MFILQIADFHMDPSADINVYKHKVQKLLPILQQNIPPHSDILCCLLGDFSDKGNDGSFLIANEVLSDLMVGLRSIWPENIIEYEIVPGNHDLCNSTKWPTKRKNLSAFNDFASTLLERKINYSSTKSIVESNHFGYHFISVSTVISEETSFGSMDFDALESTFADPGSIVIAHHGVVSSDDADSSSIRNGYRLHQFLEDKKCSAFLHGHTHGFKRYTVGNGCQVVGVGPMFKNEGKYDVSNQCNILKVTGGLVREIKTLTYQGDRDTWDSVQVYSKPEDNNYVNSDAYALYCQVLKDAQENKLLPNLRIQIQTSYTDYEKTITESFSTCKDDATAWQSPEPNEYLEFTHGQQMNLGGISWQDFIVQSLRQNPTTKRAIIPLIDKEKAFRAADDQYLVSLDIIQVGFSSDACKNLYITVYMRALEVRHFLPINLYEVYLIAKTIKNYFSSIEEINICLFAYRAEAKENYGCFKKSEIDVIRESKLSKLLTDKNYPAIVALLKQKRTMGETVIDVSWLNKLKNAVTDCCQADNTPALIAQIDRITAKLNALKKHRSQCSDYSITQDAELLYCAEIERLIVLFQENEL